MSRLTVGRAAEEDLIDGLNAMMVVRPATSGTLACIAMWSGESSERHAKKGLEVHQALG